MFQFPGQGKPAIGVVFDSDFGNRIDTVLALALLYGLEGKNECRVAVTTTTKSSLQSAALLEIMARFWANNPPPALFAMFGRPIGMATGTKDPQETAITKAVLTKQGADAKPAYLTTIKQLNDTADPAPLIRNVFTAHHDENCMVVVSGPATNLVRCMSLPGVKELAAKKVKHLVLAETAALASDPAALQKLVAEWPTTIYFAPADLGKGLKYPGETVDSAFTWATGPHPLVDAYKAYKPMPYDAPAGELAAALFAVRSSLFQLSEPGTLSADAQGKVAFTANAGGKHRSVSMNDANRDQIQKAFIELTSAKPVPRAPRRRPPMEEQKKPEPAKPAAQTPPKQS